MPDYPCDFGENEIEAHIDQVDTNNGAANAILVVGHAPQLGWIAETILHQPIAIARAELVCIAVSDSHLDHLLRRDRWLMYTIVPSDDEAIKQLREKIKSKMDLAGILGAVIIGLLGLWAPLFGSLPTAAPAAIPWTMYVSATLLFTGLGLYVATMYAYDRLLMPIRFWAESASIKDRRWLVQRPPSSAGWVLYQNMIRVWNWLFTPATWSVIGGLLFLAHAIFRPPDMLVAAVIPLLLLFALYYRHFRPTLGTED